MARFYSFSKEGVAKGVVQLVKVGGASRSESGGGAAAAATDTSSQHLALALSTCLAPMARKVATNRAAAEEAMDEDEDDDTSEATSIRTLLDAGDDGTGLMHHLLLVAKPAPRQMIG